MLFKSYQFNRETYRGWTKS